MATLDPQSDAVVIRIVYDGAPMAGKSTSLRALGRGLAAEVLSPAEIGGRTAKGVDARQIQALLGIDET